MIKAAVLLGSLLLGACSVGEVNSLATGGDGGGSGSGSGSGNGCMNAETPGTAHTHGGAAGPTNAGMNCIVAGCHLPAQLGTDAPPFEFAGTLYKVGTTTPFTGANIIITPTTAGGTPLALVTDDAGNFSVGPTLGAAVPDMPASITVTACPSIMTSHMTGAVPPPIDTNTTPIQGGGCNGCHTAAATPDPVISL